MNLQGKTALVTGSTSGIGLGIARAFAAEGANVVINGFGDKAEIEAIRKSLEDKGGKALYHAADMTKPAEIADLIATAEREFGGVDVLVNNAGIFEPKGFFDIPDEDWSRFFEVNVMSGVRLSRGYMQGMLKRNWGRIVFISSESGLNIPTGIPLFYELDDNLKPVTRGGRYLDPEAAAAGAKAVANQGNK